MSLDGPIEICSESSLYCFQVYAEPGGIYVVDEPAHLDFTSVRATLMRVVPLCLDSDPSLVPISCKLITPSIPDSESSSITDESEDRDPDDFSFWSERQAKRICMVIKQTFDVEYVPEVVVADANLTALANRILLSKQILTT